MRKIKKTHETRSQNIETRVAQAQDELKDLVKQKVDGKIKIGKMNIFQSILEKLIAQRGRI